MTTYLENLTQGYRSVRARLDAVTPPPNRPPAEFQPAECPSAIVQSLVIEWFDAWEEPPLTKPETIERETCDEFGVTLVDLRSDRRNYHLVRARHKAMWRMRHETYLSLPAIGKRFRRDHTTVLHGVKKHQQRIDAGEV